LGIQQDKHDFFLTNNRQLASVSTSKEGIFVVGCAEGPKDVQNSITQAEAAVGKVMSY